MHPVVLHHGLFGVGDLKIGPVRLSYFRGIDRAIAARGHPLIITNVHPSSSIENRAKQMKEIVLRQLRIMGHQDQKVILIAHSLGGLDARYAVAKLGMADRVAAVVTITTPHRGSPFADWVVKNLGQRLGGMKLVKLLGLDLRAIMDLTTGRCALFNQEILDVPGVRYYSISAAQAWKRVAPMALHAHRVVTAAEGDNDGLVSVQSSTWAKHLGVWPADHWQTINHRYNLRRDDPGNDIIPLWLKMLDQVAAELGGPVRAP